MKNICDRCKYSFAELKKYGDDICGFPSEIVIGQPHDNKCEYFYPKSKRHNVYKIIISEEKRHYGEKYNANIFTAEITQEQLKKITEVIRDEK